MGLGSFVYFLESKMVNKTNRKEGYFPNVHCGEVEQFIRPWTMVLWQERTGRSISEATAAELNELLRQGREDLNGVFSASDYYTMLDCVQEEQQSPDQMQRLATNICDHLGIELDEYEDTFVAGLVNGLLGLTMAQSVALSDLLSRTWLECRGVPGRTFEEFWESLGIGLREASAA